MDRYRQVKSFQALLRFYKFKLLRLAAFLQVSGAEEKTRRGRVLFLVAVAAFNSGDYNFAVTTCRTLKKEGYGPAWTVCRCVAIRTDRQRKY